MKNKKGFERKSGVLVINIYQMSQEFEDIFHIYADDNDSIHRGYNKYYSEFDPDTNQDYSQTFTQASLEEYWKDQTKDNNYVGSLDDFIKDYRLQLDVWFINCGYDFTGITEIILSF